MPLKIVVRKQMTEMDIALAKLFPKLVEILNDNLLAVESFDGWDGSNVRIVVRTKEDEVIEKIFDAIEKVEQELDVPGTIIPDIVTPDEARMQEIDVEVPVDKTLPALKKTLGSILGDNLLAVESFDGWDGSNVRIVVRTKEDEVIEKIFDAIEKVEQELGVPGTIIPDIVTPNELRILH